jgi:hypothetical protein
MTRLRPPIVALIAMLALAGCESVTVSFAPSAPAPVATPLIQAYTLNTSVWFAGLQITFRTATSVLTQYGGTVTVDVQFQNPGTDETSLAAPMQLVLGTTRIDPEHGTTLPDVPANGLSEVQVVYDVVGQGSVDEASIVVGGGGDNQATVPLGAPSRATTLAPVSLNVNRTANAADLRVHLASGVVRWDLPDWGDELPSGHVALTLTYDLTYRGTFSGGFAFTDGNVALGLPDGALIKPRPDGHSQSNAVLPPGKVQPHLASRFELPALEHGTYTFIVTNGSAHANITFTISG